jgi:hypothetical protein
MLWSANMSIILCTRSKRSGAEPISVPGPVTLKIPSRRPLYGLGRNGFTMVRPTPARESHSRGGRCPRRPAIKGVDPATSV